MTDAERLAKLEQAVALIREVEFSYPYGSDERSRLYSWGLHHSAASSAYLGQLIDHFKRKLGIRL